MDIYEFHQYVIIGAGISGLQAAMVLIQQMKDFIILQASSVLGGRIATETLGQIFSKQVVNQSFGLKQDQPKWVKQKKGIDNVPIENGATWIAESHQFMKRLIKQLNLEMFPQFQDGLFIYGDKPGSYLALDSYTSLYDQKTKEKIAKFLNKIEQLKNTLKTLSEQAIEKKNQDKIQPYRNFINEFDTLSVADFIKYDIKDPELAACLMNFIQCLLCLSCQKLSVLQLLDRNSDMILEIVYETVQDGRESDDGYRVKTGMLSIIRKMFEKIMENFGRKKQSALEKDIIRFNEPVIKIETQQDGDINIHVKGGKIYRTKKILNSIPLATLNKVQITNLPIGKQLLFDGQEMGNVYRVYMVFQQPFWRNKFNGYGTFGPSFPFNQISDLSPANNQFGVLIFVFYAHKYKKWIQSNPDPSQRFIFLKNVISDMMLNGDQNSDLLKDCYTFVRTFQNHQHIKAAYQPITKMGVWKAIQDAGAQYGQTFEKDENGVYFIGSQFDSGHGSFMEGGVRRARKEVYKLLSKADPWQK